MLTDRDIYDTPRWMDKYWEDDLKKRKQKNVANITLSGIARWAKVQSPDKKYNYYGVDVRLDDESLKLFQASGITTVKPSKDGEGYYSFKRRPDQVVWVNREQRKAGPPVVVDKHGEASSDLIGNGSQVEITVTTFPYDNNYGKGIGCRLDSVRIIDLVPFEQKTETDQPRFQARF